MKLKSLARAKSGRLLLVATAALVLSSCATLTAQQEADNAVTRHEQQAEGIRDPMKER